MKNLNTLELIQFLKFLEDTKETSCEICKHIHYLSEFIIVLDYFYKFDIYKLKEEKPHTYFLIEYTFNELKKQYENS